MKVPGGELRIIFQVKENAEGKLMARMASPDQGATNIPVESVTWKNDSLILYVKAVGGTFTARHLHDSSSLTGHWVQSGASFPLILKKTDSLNFYPKRPQEPVRPYPYLEEEVRFENQAEGILLGGTLTLPRGKAPFPAVILISGSGSQNRDEEIMGHKPFLIISDYLTRRGIAVLRYDDRGVGQSTGNPANATTAHYAQDVRAGINYLKTRPDLYQGKIGLIGHSEGGLIAPMVAASSKDIACIVLMAAPGLDGERAHRRQSEDILRKANVSDEEITKALSLNDQIYALIKAEKDSAALSQKLKVLLEKHSSGKGVDITLTLQFFTRPWFRYFINYDPKPSLKKTSCPVLAINGSKDIQVAAKDNLKAIADALKEGGNPKASIHELADLNHLFQTAATGEMSEYTKIDETFSPSALKLIGDWLTGILKP